MAGARLRTDEHDDGLGAVEEASEGDFLASIVKDSERGRLGDDVSVGDRSRRRVCGGHGGGDADDRRERRPKRRARAVNGIT